MLLVFAVNTDRSFERCVYDADVHFAPHGHERRNKGRTQLETACWTGRKSPVTQPGRLSQSRPRLPAADAVVGGATRGGRGGSTDADEARWGAVRCRNGTVAMFGRIVQRLQMGSERMKRLQKELDFF